MLDANSWLADRSLHAVSSTQPCRQVTFVDQIQKAWEGSVRCVECYYCFTERTHVEYSEFFEDLHRAVACWVLYSRELIFLQTRREGNVAVSRLLLREKIYGPTCSDHGSSLFPVSDAAETSTLSLGAAPYLGALHEPALMVLIALLRCELSVKRACIRSTTSSARNSRLSPASVHRYLISTRLLSSICCKY